jgi:hypothetical protein
MLTSAHARELIERIIVDDDGAHAPELLELLNGITDPDNTVALEVKRYLFTFTPEFEASFSNYFERRAA